MLAKYIRNKGMEAGIQQGIFTLDDTLADKMRQIRIHGQKVKHQHPLVGINGRLDTMQAAILLEKFS
jgi:UDP-2-acetamido-2-deoxy-ribo-hexuluronate aminotransferase